ncbi:hypothetical protein [Ferruginibacter sp.]
MDRRILYFLLVFTIVVGVSCMNKYLAAVEKKFNNNEVGWRPDDFDPKKGTLLIQRVRKKWQKRIESYMAKNYPYKYEYFNYLSNLGKFEKYEDTTEYRFVLVSTDQVIWADAPQDNNPETIKREGIRNVKPDRLAIESNDFYFLDRLTGKTYSKSGMSGTDASIPIKSIIGYYLKKK